MEGFMIRTGFYDKCARQSAPPSHGMLSTQRLHSKSASGPNRQCELGLAMMSMLKYRAE